MTRGRKPARSSPCGPPADQPSRGQEDATRHHHHARDAPGGFAVSVVAEDDRGREDVLLLARE